MQSPSLYWLSWPCARAPPPRRAAPSLHALVTALSCALWDRSRSRLWRRCGSGARTTRSRVSRADDPVGCSEDAPARGNWLRIHAPHPGKTACRRAPSSCSSFSSQAYAGRRRAARNAPAERLENQAGGLSAAPAANSCRGPRSSAAPSCGGGPPRPPPRGGNPAAAAARSPRLSARARRTRYYTPGAPSRALSLSLSLSLSTGRAAAAPVGRLH